MKRKNKLRLKYWDYKLTGPYFVTICSYKKLIIFEDELIRNSIIEIIRNVGAALGARIHNIVIAQNHIHILCSISENKTISLSRLMAIIKVRITQYFKRAGKPAPTIWQRSYYEHVIRNDEDFLQKASYIENHPFKEIGNNYAEWH